MTSERSEFEKWAVMILGDNPNWRESGDCELAWQSWQARAALATQPAVKVDHEPVAWMLEDGSDIWTASKKDSQSRGGVGAQMRAAKYSVPLCPMNDSVRGAEHE